MKSLTKFRGCLLVCVGLAPALASAAPLTANEVFGRYFYEPELLAHLRDQLELTSDQTAELQVEVQTAQERIAFLQEKVRQETERLVPLANLARVDETAILDQAGKILDVEQEVKHVQLKLLVRLKNLLTLDQQARLKGIKDRQSGLQDKLAKAQQLILEQQRAGRDLTALEKFKQEFDALMRQGRLEPADAVLDRTLKFLEQAPAKPGAGPR